MDAILQNGMSQSQEARKNRYLRDAAREVADVLKEVAGRTTTESPDFIQSVLYE